MPIDLNIATTFLGDTDTPNTYVGQATKKVVVNALETALEFVPDSAGSDTNIMNTNIIATGDREQSMNSYSMSFINGKQFKWINNVAPTIGEGSFDFNGYGTTSTDELIKLKNGVSSEIINIKGDGQLIHNGQRDFSSASGSNDQYTRFNAFGNFGANYLKFYRNNGGTLQGEIGVNDVAISSSHSSGILHSVFSTGVNIGGNGSTMNASSILELNSTTKGFRLIPMTATQASAITPSEGLELNVSNTNGTFTSIGKWQYIGGAWVKL